MKTSDYLIYVPFATVGFVGTICGPSIYRNLHSMADRAGIPSEIYIGVLALIYSVFFFPAFVEAYRLKIDSYRILSRGETALFMLVPAIALLAVYFGLSS